MHTATTRCGFQLYNLKNNRRVAARLPLGYICPNSELPCVYTTIKTLFAI